MEYLGSLIQEYFAADLRQKAYHKRRDKDYWLRVAEYKRGKIINITSRNNIPNIFDSKELYDKYYDRFFPGDDIPALLSTGKDMTNYFSEGSDVTVTDGDHVMVGRIKTVSIRNQVATIYLFDYNEERPYSLTQVKRIF